ncbi:MAG: hypothetical protein ACLF0G_00040 [Candidatus Brocadiia bacterium]
MAADLAGARPLRRESLLVEGDCLIVLEHSGGGRDRLRRILFDRVESLLVWRTLPWVRMLGVALLLGVPAAPFLLVPEAPAAVGWVILGCLLVAEGRYVYDRKTHIRVCRAGVARDFATVTRPGKVRRVIGTLRANIDAAQAEAHRRAAEQAAEAQEPEQPEGEGSSSRTADSNGAPSR